MDMKVSLIDFLKSGSFGPVSIGMSKDKVLSLLGEPSTDNDLGETGSILIYAWYELFFSHQDELYSIQNDNYEPSDRSTYYFKNDKFEIDSWFLNEEENQSIEDISAILDRSDLKYTIIDYYERAAIKLNSGVVIDFDDEENDDGIQELLGVRYWPHNEIT